jgi:hypothetical protein
LNFVESSIAQLLKKRIGRPGSLHCQPNSSEVDYATFQDALLERQHTVKAGLTLTGCALYNARTAILKNS